MSSPNTNPDGKRLANGMLNALDAIVRDLMTHGLPLNDDPVPSITSEQVMDAMTDVVRCNSPVDNCYRSIGWYPQCIDEQGYAHYYMAGYEALRLTGERAMNAAEGEHRLKAEQRALMLLTDCIGDDAFHSLTVDGYLEVCSPGESSRYYRIPQDATKRVALYEFGEFVAELCIDAKDWIPSGDRILLHKLMIEGDEENYLTTANWFERNGRQIPNPYRTRSAVSRYCGEDVVMTAANGSEIRFAPTTLSEQLEAAFNRNASPDSDYVVYYDPRGTLVVE